MAGNSRKLRLRPERIAFYSALALTLLATVAGLKMIETASTVVLDWQNLDFESIEEVQILQEFLRVDTSHATGRELDGALFLARHFEEAGIDHQVIDMGGGFANLVAVLPGRTHEKIILHNHLDLDPILKPEAWIHPPYGGVIEAPWIYGRGAFDMKSVTIAQMTAMIELKRRGVAPQRSIVFLATSSEETDSQLGTLWLLRNRFDLFEDAWLLLTEGGVLEARGIRDVKYWGTENSQKRFIKVYACSSSRQRLEDLRSDLMGRGPTDQRLRITPEVARFLDDYATSRDHPRHVEALVNPRSLLFDRQAFDELPPYLRELFYDEVGAFPVEADADGSGFSMRITLSLLNDTRLEEVFPQLLPPWMIAGLTLVIDPERGSREGSDPDHAFYSVLDSVLRDRLGEVPNGIYYQARSTTDARYFRAWGIPSYGFTPFLAMTTDTLGISGPNEGIALPAFLDGVDLYRQILERLATAD